MIQIKKFVFNAFQVNTYLLYDETKECIIIDAACSTAEEEKALQDYIESNQLKPIMALNTHAHIDHILGNAFVCEQYNIKLGAHSGGEMYLETAPMVANTYGLHLKKTIRSHFEISDHELFAVGNSLIMILYTPGHAAGSVCIYCEEASFLISGDVLFYQSIGRTDLPGGDYDLLKNSIWQKLFVLPDETIVYPGHGPETNIGSEKVNNPFVAIG